MTPNDTRGPSPPTAGPDPRLRDSLDLCRDITRRHARNFYWGMRLTPEPTRSLMFAVYAWMRRADDIADDPGDLPTKRLRLNHFREQTDDALDPTRPVPAPAQGDPPLLWPAVAHAFRLRRVPPHVLHDMIDGQLHDQSAARCHSFDELRRYCYLVAGTVGLVCVHVWGYDDSSAAREMAVERGIAFQLTNILRDLVEDARRGRVYLPADELRRFGYRPDDFAGLLQHPEAREFDRSRFLRLMTFQIERARGCYERSAALERHIAPDCRPTARAMMRIYRGLMEKIAADPAAVLRRRVSLGPLAKALIALRSIRG